ncbi:hypothetical protein Q5530_31705 [Saccharothrix sp. BKS2]|uniref:hypothetical protein n=1 Tax=Saccharothrix sp. BKS2 TaxID=3064400 RepID=UPI0039EA06CE
MDGRGPEFTRRDSQLRPGELADVYLLGHEELRVSVVAALGDERLEACRHRLHQWADEYRDRLWPVGTPEYLLHGYHSLLLASGDLGRAVDLATDPDRHDRVLDVSGGDALAVDEITASLRALAGCEHVDLAAMARLAVHRDHLGSRGLGIPAGLPALWAALGFYSRAVSLVRSIGSSFDRVGAFRSTAETLFAAGQAEYAHQVVDHLVEVAWAQAFVVQRAVDLAMAVRIFAKAGEFERAAAVAGLTGHPGELRAAVLDVAGELADSGAHGRARGLLRHFESLAAAEDRTPARQARELADAAHVLAVVGERGRAREMAKRARELSLIPGDPAGRAAAALAVVRCLNTLGARRRARRYARKATSLMALRPDEYEGWILHGAVLALIEAGLLVRGRTLIRKMADSLQRDVCVEALAVAYARRGDHHTAVHLVAWSGLDSRLVSTWCEVALALVRGGNHAAAEAIAFDLRDRLIHRLPNPNSVLLGSVKILCAAGNLGEAEVTALGAAEDGLRAEALAVVAEALVGRGMNDRAEALLRRAEAAVVGRVAVGRQAEGHIRIAEALLDVGDLRSARVIGDHLPELIQRARLLHAEVAAGVAGEDASVRLIELADQMEDRNQAARVLTWAAEALSRTGDVEQALRLLVRAEGQVKDDWQRDNVCGAIAIVLATAGEPEEALVVTYRNGMSGWRQLLEVLPAVGEPALARELMRQVDSSISAGADPGTRMLRADLVEPFVAVGDLRRANDLVDDLIEYLRATPDPEPGSGDSGLGELAGGVFALRDPDEEPYVVERVISRMRRAAGTIDYMNQASLARPLALAWVRVGNLDSALELATMVTDADRRGDVLLDIAAALLQEDNRHEARPLIAEALRLGDGRAWSEVVVKVGRFLPEVVQAVGAEVVVLVQRRVVLDAR